MGFDPFGSDLHFEECLHGIGSNLTSWILIHSLPHFFKLTIKNAKCHHVTSYPYQCGSDQIPTAYMTQFWYHGIIFQSDLLWFQMAYSNRIGSVRLSVVHYRVLANGVFMNESSCGLFIIVLCMVYENGHQ